MNKLIKALNYYLAGLLIFASFSSLAIQPDELLPAEQAFAAHASVIDAATVRARWEIAEGYYMYRERFRFESKTAGIRLGEPIYPAGKIKNDEFFGEMETYRTTVEIEIPLQRTDPSAQVLELATISQGCADLGVCYPPQKVSLLLDLPPVTKQTTDLLTTETGFNDVNGLAGQQSNTLFDGVNQNNNALLDGLNQGNNALLGETSLLAENISSSELPQPEYAFIPTVEVIDQQTLQARWVIDECCYMYREQFQFASLTEGANLDAPRFPQGIMQHDEFYGEVEIYRNQVSVDIPLSRSQALTEMEVQIRFQGCADIGVCYPPQTQVVPVQLPPVSNALLTQAADAQPPLVLAATGAGFVAEQDRIAALLLEQKLWSLPAFFGFGLLLALTPCVFPMIPILSGIIVGQKQITRQRAFLLSLIYVLAMALTYTAIGVSAALAGANIQIWFQNPWVISTFAAVFVALAFSMFGFYELQVPVRWQSRLTEISNRQGSGYTGVAMMGLLSALIVGPCVAPPLIGVLTVIGTTGDAVLGGSALFVMSLGMGVPLLLIGASAGQWLPKAGAWMNTIKAVFGVLLLAVAIYLLERIVPTVVAMLLWAGLLIICAVYMGALHSTVGKSGWHTLARGLGVVLLVYGVLLLVGVAAGGRDTWQPLRGVLYAGNAPAQQTLAFRSIKTNQDLDQIIAQAGGRPVMLDFYADWCVSCKEMEAFTFSDAQVQAQLNQAILLKADVTANDAADQALLQRFNLIGPPAILFFGSDGAERKAFRVVGFMPAEQFSGHLSLAFGAQISQLLFE